jgi:hypothetical protein
MGEALHSEREPLATLEQIRSTIGTYNFASQYQQTPSPSGGGMVKEAWFRRYTIADRPTSFDPIVQNWDTANKPSELADYSVCAAWGLVHGRNKLLALCEGITAERFACLNSVEGVSDALDQFLSGAQGICEPPQRRIARHRLFHASMA